MGITWRALKTALLEILIWLRWSVDVGPCNMLRSLDVLLKIIESILPILSMKGTFYLHVKRILGCYVRYKLGGQYYEQE